MRPKKGGGGSAALSGRAWSATLQRSDDMCPACLQNAALIIASVMSTGGLTLVMNKLEAKNNAKKSLQNPIPKEETWEK
jgi:hypothetical protein